MPPSPIAAANGCSDQALLERFYVQGDGDAFQTFVERHRAWALTVAKRFFPAEAEDIVQVSILRLMDCEPEGGLVTNPLGWWHTILAAAAMDHVRADLRRRRREQANAQEARAEAERPSVEGQAAADELLDAIHAEILQLEDGFRAPLLKRYFEGMSYREIGAALECSTGTVGSRLSRGIARIRAGLADKGLLDAGKDNDLSNL